MFAAAAASAACGSIFDDDGIPYAFCGGRCAPASLCTDAATSEAYSRIFDDDGLPYAFCDGRCAPASACNQTSEQCVGSCIAPEFWSTVDDTLTDGLDGCRSRCFGHGVDHLHFVNGSCSCLGLRGDASAQEALQWGSSGSLDCTVCTQHADHSALAASADVNASGAVFHLVLRSEPTELVNVSILPRDGIHVHPSVVIFSSLN